MLGLVQHAADHDRFRVRMEGRAHEVAEGAPPGRRARPSNSYNRSSLGATACGPATQPASSLELPRQNRPRLPVDVRSNRPAQGINGEMDHRGRLAHLRVSERGRAPTVSDEGAGIDGLPGCLGSPGA